MTRRPPRSGEKWRREEDRVLIALGNNAAAIEAFAALIGRSYGSVVDRRTLLRRWRKVERRRHG